jgi:hypothetical protein
MAALCLTLAIAGTAGAQLGQGKVLFEYWDNIGGTSVDTDLRTNANFPDNPTSSVWLDNFQSPSGRADNYGVRGRAFVTPPETGDYTFWVAGDDNCQLWLSTDDTAANATMIAQVASWSGVAEWTKEAGQKSAPVALVGGQTYYIEALMKEGGGGDSLDVGWAGPGIGDAATVLAGQYCTAFLRDPEPLLMAQNPKPADKAVDVTNPLFEWTGGITAVTHDIYFGTTPELTDADYQTTMPAPMYYHMGTMEPGVTYYWRVDQIDAAGDKFPGKVWSFTVMPLTAHAPVPADAAKDVAVLPTLTWTAGQNVLSHVLYFGKDLAAVTAADAAVQMDALTDTSFTPTVALDAFSTYYWRVDQVDMAGATLPGEVWSFSTISYVPILAAQTALNYNNRAEPFTSTLSVDIPLDLTAGGKLAELAISFLGQAGPTGGLAYDEATLTYSLTAAGADIWGTADQFHYAYKMLNGDGTMIARVASVGTGTSEWAKGGVMIRQSLAAGSTHAYMPITGPSATAASGGNGASFQRRLVADLDSTNNDNATRVEAPYWVKIERKGDAFTGFISADGVEWAQLGEAQTIAMGNPVYIGLAATSHVGGALRTFQFDNVATTGEVTPDGPFVAWDDIGIASNDPAPIAVSIEDATGAVAAVVNPNPAASQVAAWELWTVPLESFVGVDLTNAAKLHIAVGDGQPGGTGAIQVRDIRTTEPTSKGTVVWVSFHPADETPSAGAAGVGFTVAPDKPYTDLLEAQGYEVVRYVTTATPDMDLLNSADLVIISRSVPSGNYQNAAASTWNGVTAPTMILGGYIVRKNRMGFVTGNTIPDTTGDIQLTVTDPTHPIFAGIAMTDGTMDNPYCGLAVYPTDGTTAAGLSIVTEPITAGGTLLATVSAASAITGPAGAMVIAEYPAGTSLAHDGGAGTDVLAGPRLVFLTGARENGGKSSETAGLFDLYDDGAQMFVNAVEYMIQ